MRSTRNMTEGPVGRQLFFFAVPILFGELFQQLYNTVDSAIVGTYVGTEALAAVGATNSVTKMLVGFFLGVSIGCTTVTARTFGADDTEKLQDTVNVIMLLSATIGVALSVIGVVITPLILRLIHVPSDVLPLATIYLRIYFGGIMGFVLYNASTGILRAVGDSHHPLMFLIASSLLNVILDYVLVVHAHLGVAGVALATVIAQLLAAMVCIALLMRTKETYRWIVDLHFFKRDIIRDIMDNGLPTGVQKTLTQFSNTIVVSFVTPFGADCIAGWTIYQKVNSFLLITSQSLSSSATTFVSQNVGAGKEDRIERGIRTAMLYALLTNCLFIVLFLALDDPIIACFGKSAEVAAYAKRFMHSLIYFTLLQSVQSILAGGLRGLGKARAATHAMLFGLIVIRQLYLNTITHFINTPVSVCSSYAAGWAASAAILLVLLLRTMRRRKESRSAMQEGLI